MVVVVVVVLLLLLLLVVVVVVVVVAAGGGAGAWVRSATDEHWEEDSDVSHYLDMMVLTIQSSSSLCFGMVGLGKKYFFQGFKVWTSGCKV